MTNVITHVATLETHSYHLNLVVLFLNSSSATTISVIGRKIFIRNINQIVLDGFLTRYAGLFVEIGQSKFKLSLKSHQKTKWEEE